MDIDRFQRWLSLCANIAIIGGIIFLAVEINQNTQVTISDASQEITNQSLDYFTRGIDSAVLARALYKQSTDQELTGLEFQQVWFHQYINFRVFENAYLQYLRGYFQESEWARYRRIIARRLSSDYVAAQLWQDTDSRGDWTSEFSEEVNDIVSTITMATFSKTTAESLSTAQKDQIEAEVRQTLQDYAAAALAGDLERGIAFWGDFEDFIHAGDGRVFGDREAWIEYMSSNQPDEFISWEYTDVNVAVLGVDAASYTANFEIVTMVDGEESTTTGSWTYVLRKTEDGWRVVHSNGKHNEFSYYE